MRPSEGDLWRERLRFWLPAPALAAFAVTCAITWFVSHRVLERDSPYRPVFVGVSAVVSLLIARKLPRWNRGDPMSPTARAAQAEEARAGDADRRSEAARSGSRRP